MDSESVFSPTLPVMPLLEFPASFDTFGTRGCFCSADQFQQPVDSCLVTNCPLVASFRNKQNNKNDTCSTLSHSLRPISLCTDRTDYLGYWDEEMNLNYFGRIGNQVKVRGFRVKLEEIGHAVSTAADMDPKVQNAVVITMNDDPQG
ncbi:amino acid adenylation, partial [Colletotrichum navitas]